MAYAVFPSPLCLSGILHNSDNSPLFGLVSWKGTLQLFRRPPLSTDVITLSNRERLNWPTALVFGLFHIGAIAALFMFSWKSLFISVALYWMTICFGISLGYH